MFFKILPVFLALQLIAAPVEAGSLYDPSSPRAASEAVRKRLGVRAGSIRYDARMIRAAEIAMARAHRNTTWYCWRYVKDALLAAHVVESRPTTTFAKQAGDELCRRYGFTRIRTRDPKKAPVGAVIVYGGADAGHVEIRTRRGYVSDFTSRTPYPRPVLGIFVKPA